MADNKNGREKKAQDAERRQREREVAEELARGNEPEPPVDAADLVDIELELESLTFPATGSDIVAAVGNRVIESTEGRYTVEALVPETDVETFDSPTAVSTRIQRPTIAEAMKRVLEAAGRLPNSELSRSQHDAYKKTFRELEAIVADDDDEGIQAISEWIVERIQDKESPPGSRDVRRQAAKYCRTNGYQVRDDEWLGV